METTILMYTLNIDSISEKDEGFKEIININIVFKSLYLNNYLNNYQLLKDSTCAKWTRVLDQIT